MCLANNPTDTIEIYNKYKGKIIPCYKILNYYPNCNEFKSPVWDKLYTTGWNEDPIKKERHDYILCTISYGLHVYLQEPTNIQNPSNILSYLLNAVHTKNDIFSVHIVKMYAIPDDLVGVNLNCQEAVFNSLYFPIKSANCSRREQFA